VACPESALGAGLAGVEVAIRSLGRDGVDPGSVRSVNASPGGFSFGGRDDDQKSDVLDMLAPDERTQSERLSFTADEQATGGYSTVVSPVAPDTGRPTAVDGDDVLEDVDRTARRRTTTSSRCSRDSDSRAVEANGAFDFNANGRFDFDDLVDSFENLSG
jgi:hypothetical protein